MKEQFIENLVWSNTVGAAFQRATVYKSKDLDINLKNAFKGDLHQHIKALSETDYLVKVDDGKHIENIKAISEFTAKNHGKILTENKLNFGVSQKLLNLYLKYKWCLGHINVPPPHFPVDRMIQGLLKVDKIDAWTKMGDEKSYIKVIEHAEKYRVANGYNSLAELELDLYNRG